MPMSNSSRVVALLFEVVPTIIREMRNDLCAYKRSNRSAVTVLQFRILANLNIESANNKNLAGSVGISVPAMSRLVKAMAKKGFVKSVKVSSDKREVRVVLTAKGKTIYKKSTATLGKELNNRISNMTSVRLQQAELGLRALKNIFAELNSAQSLSVRKVI